MKDTKTLLDEYFKTRPESTVKKIRGQIDRPELYEYEKKIGKTIVEMTPEEIAQMIRGFKNKSFSKNKFKFSYRTYDALLSILRDFFNWYIDTYEVIKNPCNDKKIKGMNVLSLFSDSNDIFTKESVKDIINKIRSSQVEEYANYLEAIIRMFYEGFAEAIDIVNLKEDEVNNERKTVLLNHREIKLSDRLYDLLNKINHMDSLPANRGDYLLLSYRNSFFKFPTRERFKNDFNDRPPEYWGAYINRILNREIKNKLEINVNARTLYLCGFYDFMVSKVGQDEADELIIAKRDSEKAKALMTLAKEYGVVEQNVTILKKIMLPFVPQTKINNF